LSILPRVADEDDSPAEIAAKLDGSAPVHLSETSRTSVARYKVSIVQSYILVSLKQAGRALVLPLDYSSVIGCYKVFYFGKQNNGFR
jgi:hypothetical protein